MAKLSDKINNYIVTKKGSLGLLAYGDIGLRSWRKIRGDQIIKLNDEK